MGQMIEVLKAGTEVQIGPKDAPLSAVVLQVCVGVGDRVSYQCAYWKGQSRETVWLEEWEVWTISKPEVTIIGFR